MATEGPRALYKGVTANAVGSGLAWGSYFYGYEWIKSQIHAHTGATEPGPLTPGAHVAAAMLAGALTLFATNPIWVVKTRMVRPQFKAIASHPRQTLWATYRRQVVKTFTFAPA